MDKFMEEYVKSITEEIVYKFANQINDHMSYLQMTIKERFLEEATLFHEELASKDLESLFNDNKQDVLSYINKIRAKCWKSLYDIRKEIREE